MKNQISTSSRRSLRIVICFVFIMISISIFGAKSYGNPETGVKTEAPVVGLSEKISSRVQKALKESGFKEGEIGIWVGRQSDSGVEALFGQNAEKSFIPASLSKLVTAAAVLHHMHPGFKFKTQLVSNASLKNGALAGPLYLKGGGDPSFVSENMWVLVNEFTRSGITKINGDVIVDDTRFDADRFGNGRQTVRVDRAYDAPIGAMSMNWNAVSVFVRPGEKVGEKLKVVADISSPYLKVRNNTKTVAAGRGRNISVERKKEKGFFGDVVEVNGAMALGHQEVVVYKSISHPDLWAGYNLVEFLKQRGITVTGQVRAGAAPKDATVLATSESKPLAAVVADMSKWSNNYVAEMLVKNLAAESGLVPATMEAGLEKVRAYFESLGFAKDTYEYINAAGFTRDNRITPKQIGTFLESARQDFTMFPEFLASLPIGGVDGTLRSRMKGSKAENWVRAKTGLLNGVVGLAGYAGRANGTVLTFAFIYNGAGREDRARAFFDALASRLVED